MRKRTAIRPAFSSKILLIVIRLATGPWPHRWHGPTKTHLCRCENVPAFFSIFCHGTWLSQEPPRRLSPFGFQPNWAAPSNIQNSFRKPFLSLRWLCWFCTYGTFHFTHSQWPFRASVCVCVCVINSEEPGQEMGKNSDMQTNSPRSGKI